MLHHPGELLDAIAADIERRPSDYAKPDWTNIIWAFTRLGRSPGRLYAFLADEVSDPLPVGRSAIMRIFASGLLCPLLSQQHAGYSSGCTEEMFYLSCNLHAPLGQACLALQQINNNKIQFASTL